MTISLTIDSRKLAEWAGIDIQLIECEPLLREPFPFTEEPVGN